MVDPELLEILVCPETHQPVRPAEGGVLDRLNQAIRSGGVTNRGGSEVAEPLEGSSPELCVKVRGSSSMLLLGCLGDLLRFEKREIQVATFAPDRSSP